jgi:hypothetical protein
VGFVAVVFALVAALFLFYFLTAYGYIVRDSRPGTLHYHGKISLQCHSTVPGSRLTTVPLKSLMTEATAVSWPGLCPWIEDVMILRSVSEFL